MRGKRSKQYRKLMLKYSQSFAFREPYQVLVDAEIVRDAVRFKMDLHPALERTLHGKVKPMITQCCIRHLYAAKDEPAIDQAKTFERRRCGHHELPEPLSTLDCLKEVVDSKSSQTNKHRYIIASQDTDVRAYMRNIPGVPLIYINRSVMIMEPMAEATDDVRLKEERLKFRSGLKSKYPQSLLGKRARDHDDHQQKDTQVPSEKKHARGTKGVNPLSMLKPKKKASIVPESASTQEPVSLEPAEEAVEGTEKKKRKRKSTVLKEKTLHMHEILMGRKNLRF